MTQAGKRAGGGGGETSHYREPREVSRLSSCPPKRVQRPRQRPPPGLTTPSARPSCLGPCKGPKEQVHGPDSPRDAAPACFHHRSLQKLSGAPPPCAARARPATRKLCRRAAPGAVNAFTGGHEARLGPSDLLILCSPGKDPTRQGEESKTRGKDQYGGSVEQRQGQKETGNHRSLTQYVISRGLSTILPNHLFKTHACGQNKQR